jgi:predicted porin
VTDYAQVSATGNATSLISGRWRNAISYNSPQMGPFKVEVLYSTAPLTNDQDFTTAHAKGSGFMINPEFDAGFARFGWAHFNAKTEVDAGAVGALDAGGTTQQRYKGDKVWVHADFGGLKTGLIYAKWKGDTSAGVTNLRQAGWYLPLNYSVANHTFGITVGKAKDNTAVAGDQSARYRGVAYNYAFSKRTSLSASYNKMDNAANASYDLSGATGPTDGVVGFTTATAEDNSAITFALHHSF